MRKRSMYPLQRFLHTIPRQYSPAATVPAEFLKLCEVSEETENKQKEAVLNHAEEEIFFPLPSNREQRWIVSRLNENKGLLVQGPPGTGKSHTIANLICHLSAQGKRVLVTAQTARALQVLHELLPENLHPLCFNALEQGKKEQDDLEQKVKNILAREKLRQPTENEQIQELGQRLQAKQRDRRSPLCAAARQSGRQFLYNAPEQFC
ncbi:MAG: hypothetical protein D3904_17940, partial [Candidatus Electrothrix sp. EH2]|nr:hypothetical protein [Candidatus Electrothrix sp. EH2]